MADSSFGTRKKWDVFLSFRGEDTRSTFTGYLYSSLVRTGIRTFRDDDTLKRGKEIEGELFKAIEESTMAVIIFSTNYAKSTWCLKELVKVMDCRSSRDLQLMVLPVFYKVDPSDVRAQRNDFSIALDRPEIEDMIPKWRAALKTAGGLSGRALQAKGDEASFLDLVLKDVSEILESAPYTAVTNATHHVMQAMPSKFEAPAGIKASDEGASKSVRKKNMQSDNKYDVFLSFGGRDPPTKFTDTLLAALDGEGVRMYKSYKSDYKMERGKDVGIEVLKAIEESRIAVIIFSYEYAISKWCLDELVKIMNCRRDSKQLVLPLFYHIHPAKVRELKGSYEDAFTKHEKHYQGCGMEGQMKGWRAALTEAAGLPGLVFDTYGDGRAESSFIGQVVQDITNKLAHPNTATKLVSKIPASAPSTTNATRHVKQTNGNGAAGIKTSGKSKNMQSGNKYDVFLSSGGFRPPTEFTDPLLASLGREGVSTYILNKGDCEMEIGKEIGIEVLKAIEESRMAVIIFSYQYAASTWCLDELVKVMDCRRDSKLMVLPLFLQYSQAEAISSKSTYGYAFSEHAKQFKGCGMEAQMRGWRKAVTEAAGLPGLTLKMYGKGHEANFIKEIVQDISKKLASGSGKR